MKKTKLLALWVVFAGLMSIDAAHIPAKKTGAVRAIVRVLQQHYCSGDAEVFTASLKLDVELQNILDRPIAFRDDLVPTVARVSRSFAAAEAGKFDYQDAWTRYAQSEPKIQWREIAPGRSVTLHTTYALVARYKDEPSIPGTLPPGSYVAQLEFQPEYQNVKGNRSTRTNVESFSTEPFAIKIPDSVSPEQCK
jgi:hypothetical protein